MKTFLYILGVVVLAVIGYFAYKMIVPPSFTIKNYDTINKAGVFSFGGSDNSFSTAGGKSASGGNGWVVTVETENNKIVFKLFKNGKYVKTLETLS